MKDNLNYRDSYFGTPLNEKIGEEAMGSVFPYFNACRKSNNVILVRGPKEFDNDEYKYLFDKMGI